MQLAAEHLAQILRVDLWRAKASTGRLRLGVLVGGVALPSWAITALAKPAELLGRRSIRLACSCSWAQS